MQALECAPKEMATRTPELRIRKELLSRVPRNAAVQIVAGEKVRVYRETDRPYVGPYPVTRVDKKQVYVVIKDREVQFSIHQVPLADHYD